MGIIFQSPGIPCFALVEHLIVLYLLAGSMNLKIAFIASLKLDGGGLQESQLLIWADSNIYTCRC